MVSGSDLETMRGVAEAIARLDAKDAVCTAHAARIDRHDVRLQSMEEEIMTIRTERRLWNFAASMAGSLLSSVIVSAVLWLIFKGVAP